MTRNRFCLRKARRTLPNEQQRGIARKPWREIKVNPKLWSTIYIGKRAKELKDGKQTQAATVESIVIDDD